MKDVIIESFQRDFKVERFDSIEEALDHTQMKFTQVQQSELNKFIQYVKKDEPDATFYVLTDTFYKVNNAIIMDEYTFKLDKLGHYKTLHAYNALLLLYKCKVINSSLSTGSYETDEDENNPVTSLTILDKCSMVDSSLYVANKYSCKEKQLDSTVYIKNSRITNISNLSIKNTDIKHSINVSIQDTVIEHTVLTVNDTLSLNHSVLSYINCPSLTVLDKSNYRLILNRPLDNIGKMFLSKSSKRLCEQLEQEKETQCNILGVITNEGDSSILVGIRLLFAGLGVTIEEKDNKVDTKVRTKEQALELIGSLRIGIINLFSTKVSKILSKET